MDLLMMRTDFLAYRTHQHHSYYLQTGDSTPAKMAPKAEHPSFFLTKVCLATHLAHFQSASEIDQQSQRSHSIQFASEIENFALIRNLTPAAMSERARYVMSPRIPPQRPIRTNSIAFNSVFLDCVSICDASPLSSRNHLLASITGAFSRQSSAQSVHRHFASSISFCSIYHDASGPPWLPSLPVFSRSISERNLPSLSMDGLTQQGLITLVTQKYTSCLERVRGSR